MPPPRSDNRDKLSPAAARAAGAPSSEEMGKEVEALEAALHALRAQYEQFFLGLEKRPPSQSHQKLRERMGTLKMPTARSAALSFRIQSLEQKVATYERLWTRTLKEMEEGTYRRDIFKARLRRKSSAPEPPPGHPGQPGAAAVPPAAPGASPPGVRAVSPPPLPPEAREPVIHIAGTPAPDPLAENRLRSVYRAYVEAKRRCNEDTTRLSFDAVAASLKKQVPELLERHKAKDVEYRVFVKDGKAILRAVPKV